MQCEVAATVRRQQQQSEAKKTSSMTLQSAGQIPSTWELHASNADAALARRALSYNAGQDMAG